MKKFTDKITEVPKQGSSEPETDFNRRRATWQQELNSTSLWATVVSATQMSWESPNGPWNVGYIENFSQKIESGELKWDITVERKAGGLDIASPGSLGSC